MLLIHHTFFASQLCTGINSKGSIRHNLFAFSQTIRDDIAIG